MKALVTGSTGFVGNAICRGLLDAGYEVRAFHRPSSSLRLLEGLPVEQALGDLTQPETLLEAMQGVDAVFHAAALLGVREDPGPLQAVTVEGTRAVLQGALQAGVQRVVHTSSVAALGVPEHYGSQRMPIDERHTWNYIPERWPYGYAKYLAEMEVQKAVAQGLDVVIVNPSLVFGPRDVYRMNTSLVVQVARGRLPALVDAGINVVHIDDVARGHVSALERGRTGERYILGGENLTLKEIVQKIAALTGGSKPLVELPPRVVRSMAAPARWLRSFLNLPVDPSTLYLAGRYFYYDTHKALGELGLPSFKKAEQAFAEAWVWFQANGIA